MGNFKSPDIPEINYNKTEEESSREKENNYEERYDKLKEIMGRVYKSKNREALIEKIIVFHRGLMGKHDNHSRVRCFHALGSSSLGGENDKMTIEELLEKGEMDAFDFGGEDSVEEFLSDIEKQIK